MGLGGIVMENNQGKKKPQFALVKGNSTHKLKLGPLVIGRKNPATEQQAVDVALDVRLQ